MKVSGGVLTVPSATIAQADVTNLTSDLAAKVPTSRTISTNAPLSGGGDLGTNRTLSLDDGGITTAKLGDAQVTLAKIANIGTSRILGRVSASSGVVEELTVAQVNTLLGTSPWTYARCSVDRTTTGQALADIADLSLALVANGVYEFESILMVASSSTAGNQYGVQYSAAGATIEAQISGTLAAATSRADRISAFNTATAAYVTSGAAGGIRIQGIVVVGANAGNLTIRHLKVTSGTSTVRAQSYLKVFRIA